jgi:hypothetical protein
MPLVTLVGLTVNVTPLQLTVVIALITAVGLIVTVTVNVAPVQLPDVGVAIYVAVLAIFVVFVNVPVMLLTALDCDNPPVKPTPVGVVQVYKVPAGTIPLLPLVGLTVKPTPEHVVFVIADITAVGLIVTVIVNGVAAPQITVLGITI